MPSQNAAATLVSALTLLAGAGPLLSASRAVAQTPPAAAAVVDAVTPAAAFENGRIAFGRGEYARAIDILRPLIHPGIKLESEGQVVQTHRMLGVAHLFENQPTEARQEFIRLLELRPDYRFDPLLDPSRVVEFFNQVLSEHEQQIAVLEQRRREALEAEQRRRALLASQVREERWFARNSYAINFIPFGAGQFQNGQRGKGWGFFAAETVLGATSVAAFVTNFAVFGFRPERKCTVPSAATCPEDKIDHSDDQTSARLTQIQLVSGGLFFAVAAWGLVDALINYRELVPLPADPERVKPPAQPHAVFFPAVIAPPAGSGAGAPPTLGAGLALRF